MHRLFTNNYSPEIEELRKIYPDQTGYDGFINNGPTIKIPDYVKKEKKMIKKRMV